MWLLPVALFLGVYALDPANFVVPLLGAVDDLVLLPLLLHGVVTLLPAEIRYGFDGSWRANADERRTPDRRAPG
jgi:uncharacterized membrane protein YkvA (DUF1232 family)